MADVEEKRGQEEQATTGLTRSGGSFGAVKTARLLRDLAGLQMKFGNQAGGAKLIIEAARIELEVMKGVVSKVKRNSSAPDLQVDELVRRDGIERSGPVSSSSGGDLSSTVATLAFKLPQKRTALHLTGQIVPYLRAVAEMQWIIDEMKGQGQQAVRVVAVNESLPITVTLSGVVEMIPVIVHLIVPGQRTYREMKARLHKSERVFQAENLKAQGLAGRVERAAEPTAREKQALELATQRARVEKLGLENNKLREEMQAAKSRLALRVVTELGPNLSEAQTVGYVTALLKPLEVLVMSEVALEVIEAKARQK